jgi:hypothetical protein
MEMCICSWIGESFEIHHEETREEDRCHVQTSILMQLVLNKGETQ